MNKKLEKLNRLKTQFFANVSHELRTPLMLILGPIEKLLAVKELMPYYNDLDVVERNARVLLKLVNDLLDVAKLEAGGVTINYVNLDLAKMVRQIASLFEGYANDNNINFIIEAPRSLSAELDPDKIQRVIMNLISNAFKFTPTKGTVRCTLSSDHMYARIMIADSGPGISPELHDAVFERFFQIEEPTTRKHGGVGLGLAIVKDFVELHGGTIQIDNAPEGGAVFTLEIPLLAPPNVFTASDSEVQKSITLDNEIVPQMIRELFHERGLETAKEKFKKEVSRSSENGEKPLILIVEDNIDMNQYISETLSSSYRVSSAFDGAEGLEKALELHPDLILSDIMMPKMNGIQLVKKVREHSELSSTPIIILTAKTDDELRADLLANGVQDYLAKPFSQTELKTRIANLIELKKTRDELTRIQSERR